MKEALQALDEPTRRLTAATAWLAICACPGSATRPPTFVKGPPFRPVVLPSDGGSMAVALRIR
jgi:hypothetical protein